MWVDGVIKKHAHCPNFFKTILRFLSLYLLVWFGRVHKMNNSDTDIDANDDDEGDVKPHWTQDAGTHWASWSNRRIALTCVIGFIIIIIRIRIINGHDDGFAAFSSLIGSSTVVNNGQLSSPMDSPKFQRLHLSHRWSLQDQTSAHTRTLSSSPPDHVVF